MEPSWTFRTFCEFRFAPDLHQTHNFEQRLDNADANWIRQQRETRPAASAPILGLPFSAGTVRGGAVR